MPNNAYMDSPHKQRGIAFRFCRQRGCIRISGLVGNALAIL